MNEIKAIGNKIDELELAMLNHEPVECPVDHTFVPGMYIRKIFMPKGKEGKETWLTSLVHNTTHPFVVLKGKVAVYSENDGVQTIVAPFDGITTPGTRRVLKIIEDTVWVTYHPTDILPKDNSKEAVLEAVKLVGEQILMKYDNPLLGGHYENNVFIEANDELKLVEVE